MKITQNFPNESVSRFLLPESDIRHKNLDNLLIDFAFKEQDFSMTYFELKCIKKNSDCSASGCSYHRILSKQGSIVFIPEQFFVFLHSYICLANFTSSPFAIQIFNNKNEIINKK